MQALTRKVNLSDMMDGIDLDDDDLSSFFCSEHTAEALKRAALNHSGEGPYGAGTSFSCQFVLNICQGRFGTSMGKVERRDTRFCRCRVERHEGDQILESLSR